MWVTGQIETAVGNLRGILNAIYHRCITEPQSELETHTCHIKLLLKVTLQPQRTLWCHKGPPCLSQVSDNHLVQVVVPVSNTSTQLLLSPCQHAEGPTQHWAKELQEAVNSGQNMLPSGDVWRFLGNYSHACASTKIWNKKIQMWKMADKRPLSGLNQFRLWWNKSREASGEMLTETKNGSASCTYSVHTCYFFFNSIVFVSIKMTRHCLQRRGQVLLLWRCQNGTFQLRGPTGRKS